MTPSEDNFTTNDLPPTPSTGGGEEAGETLRPYITADPYAYTKVYEFRCENKEKGETEAESYMWQLLRNKQLGVKFRRQHIVDVYIVDFVCLSKKLVIEIDGYVHNNRKEYDFLRTQVLMIKGYTVIRFTNDEVLYNIDSVIERICNTLHKCSI